MKFYENKVFYACVMDAEFWIRFNFLENYNYNGFRVINTKKKRLRFSERIKKVKTTQIFNYNFKRLRPLSKMDKNIFKI
jgi:hypothetical protein|tara:strand:+ start:8128 stop:8364 length:237 start_codon:yes stop_codon:yes gene_type:complete